MSKALFWFRRDLRLEDNCGLYRCLQAHEQVVVVFVFDQDILEDLPQQDKRVEFIWFCIDSLKRQLQAIGADLIVIHGTAADIIRVATEQQVEAVYCNEDYEPTAIARDRWVEQQLAALQIRFTSLKDTVIFAKREILTQQDQLYHVYTPYKNMWRKRLEPSHTLSYPSVKLLDHLQKTSALPMPSLDSLGFAPTGLAAAKIAQAGINADALFELFKAHRAQHYKDARDIPSINGTSTLSVHLRFGTISIRKLVRDILKLAQTLTGDAKDSCDTWLSELIWREFYMQILANHPQVATQPFKAQYQGFPWRDDPVGFAAWCHGQTGYPLVDAAMQQLNTLGFMHNRLRMLTASFLIKLLLIDYRQGEQYFALKLLDFDLAANNGGWQWSASTGCDAQPFFRIFNPMTQSKKFDPDALFIKKYLPIFAEVPAQLLHEPWLHADALAGYGIVLGKDYPLPIVDYQQARARALALLADFKAT
jgi:deoxyribodipyrimidine photo-lyase